MGLGKSNIDHSDVVAPAETASLALGSASRDSSVPSSNDDSEAGTVGPGRRVRCSARDSEGGERRRQHGQPLHLPPSDHASLPIKSQTCQHYLPMHFCHGEYCDKYGEIPRRAGRGNKMPAPSKEQYKEDASSALDAPLVCPTRPASISRNAAKRSLSQSTEEAASRNRIPPLCAVAIYLKRQPCVSASSASSPAPFSTTTHDAVRRTSPHPRHHGRRRPRRRRRRPRARHHRVRALGPAPRPAHRHLPHPRLGHGHPLPRRRPVHLRQAEVHLPTLHPLRPSTPGTYIYASQRAHPSC